MDPGLRRGSRRAVLRTFERWSPLRAGAAEIAVPGYSPCFRVTDILNCHRPAISEVDLAGNEMYAGVVGHRSPALCEVTESHCGDFTEVNVEVWFVVSRKRREPKRVNVGTLNNPVALNPATPKSGALCLWHVSDGTYAGYGDEAVRTSLRAQFARWVQHGDGIERHTTRLTRGEVGCGEDVPVSRRVLVLLMWGHPVLVRPRVCGHGCSLSRRGSRALRPAPLHCPCGGQWVGADGHPRRPWARLRTSPGIR